MLPLVVTVEDSRGLVRHHAFAESPVRLGRSPLNDLRLDEPFVSRWQSVVRFDENEITYFNVGSTNSTRINGVPAQLHQEMVVDGTTTVSLGSLTIRFERRPVPESDLYRKGGRRQGAAAQDEVPATEAVDAARASELLAELQRRPSAGLGQRGRPSSAGLGQQGPSFAELGAGPASADLGERDPVPLVQARPTGISARATTKDPEEGPLAADALGVAATPFSPAFGFGFERGSEPPVPNNAEPVAQDTPPIPAQSIERERGQPSQRRARYAGDGSATPAAVGFGQAAESTGVPAVVIARYAAYRSSWERFFLELKKELAHLPPPLQRKQLMALRERFPDMAHEPAFMAWTQQLAPGAPGPDAGRAGGLAAGDGAALAVPEANGDVDAWFARIAHSIMPRGFLKRGSGLPVSRLLSLLEILVESFVEFQGAQEAVRKHWFGLAARDSLLKAEEPRAVLVYLLNPKADWEARVAELRQVVQELVSHELALFNATMVGARTLADRFSPERAAADEGVSLDAMVDRGKRGGSSERRLIGRLRDNFRDLMEGERYQRVFLGRAFARTYLAAMGRRQEEKNG